ncbi:unnamed protein product [Blepharisma stoltei]|uniref:Histidine kinase n=1 Tax=Blepharisma stoltei TaxID=1481888 RepID=A0AAU9J1D4_9CILI|nr:unnamed protein product [Blepharisma stoltei]
MFAFVSMSLFLNAVLTNKWIFNLMMLKHMYIWHIHPYLSSSYSQINFAHFIYAILFLVYFCNKGFFNKQKISLERFLYQKELEKSKNKLGTIAQSTTNGIIILTNNEIVFNNSSILELLNCDLPSLFSVIEKLEYCPEKKLARYSNSNFLIDDVMLTMENINTEEICLGITKLNDINLEWRAKKILWEEVPSLFLTARNANQIIELEKNIANDKMKTILLRSVSHELKTPLNAILHFTNEILEKHRSKLNSEDLQQLSMVVTSSKLMLSLINDLLDYSKILAGVFSIRKVYTNFRKIIYSTCELIEIQAKRKGLSYSCHIDPNVPEEIYTDPLRYGQVLLNLLSNALKFTMKGGIEVHFYIDCNNKLKCQVKDTGIGIPEKTMQKIFTAFNSPNNPNLNPNGSGLGLSISNYLVKELGGDSIKVKSSVSKGSLFWFSIDILQEKIQIEDCESEPDEIDDSLCTVMSRYSSFDSGCHYDILIVDDNEFNLEVLGSVLTKYNVKFAEASGGRDAIEKIKLQDKSHQFKAVIMDCNMPELDGLETTKELCSMYKQGKLRKIPYVIGYSAYSSDEDRQLSLASGMMDYLMKPCPPEEIIATINKYL